MRPGSHHLTSLSFEATSLKFSKGQFFLGLLE